MNRGVIEQFAGQRILVIGDLILDEYIFGQVRRISPEAPIPIVETTRRECRAGGACNVAMNVAALGGSPMLCGVLGGDQAADRLRELLETAIPPGDARLIAAPDRPTTLKTRVIAHNQQMLRLDTEDTRAIDANGEDAVLAWAGARMAGAGACILSDYAKGLLTDRLCRELIALGARHGVPVVIDPKGVRYERYAGCALITPNRQEAGLAANREIRTPDDLEAVAAQLLDLLGGAELLVTRGEDGMSLYRRNEPPCHIPANARAVYDVTGAGDTVIGTLALALAAGLPSPDAIVLANLAAGIVVGKLGANPVTKDEFLAALDDAGSPAALRTAV